MAFSFNWSPLLADTSRAKEMLTAALNRTPKPPIIVDDIVVSELNLGATAPELEILEVGDLAEDRFRGIFRMTYTGDAFMTLRTRVQANPLATYLSTTPAFASPRPLAAASGLTIPLQITLSDIRLSGFVILVFSRQKGLTLVFRNDPLESLKVSSTFDSIPFVRNYLQAEIEGQLRLLFMEDLPAILYKLSLRYWVPEFHDTDAAASSPGEHAADGGEKFGLFDEPSDDSTEYVSETADAQADGHRTFSKRNLLRLATFSESQRTLSPFTPPIADALFRASASVYANRRPQGHARPMYTRPSTLASAVPASENDSPADGRRPSLMSLGSFSSTATSAAGNGRARARRGKTRIVNLRRTKSTTDTTGLASSGADCTDETIYSAPSVQSVSEEREGDVTTPPRSPEQHGAAASGSQKASPSNTTKGTLSRRRPAMNLGGLLHTSPSPFEPSHPNLSPKALDGRTHDIAAAPPPFRGKPFEKAPFTFMQPAYKSPTSPDLFGSPGLVLEHAWQRKMATEMACTLGAERDKTASCACGPDAPPAYVE